MKTLTESGLVPAGAQLQQLYTGAAWGEGPVWLPGERQVRWSDIPNDRILAYDVGTGETWVYQEGVEFTNGRTLDLDGHVVQCSHGRRRIERDAEGIVTPVVDGWAGHRLNSPNDVIVASDGAIWFTDPPYGIISTREGHVADQEYDGCYVFRYDESNDHLTSVVTDMVHPNGLAMSPREDVLYVSDTGWLRDPTAPRHVRAYDVRDGQCVNGRVLAEVRPGVCDGFRVDEEGRLWCSSENAVQVYSPQGRPLGRCPVPEKVGNLCFGGPEGTDLYVVASTSLYHLPTVTRDARRWSR